MPLFDLTDHDREVYETQLADWLPDTLFDAHTHVWLDQHRAHGGDQFKRTVSWPALVAKDCSIEDLVETYRILFPGKTCGALIFSNVRPGDDFRVMNDYVAESSRRYPGYPGLVFAHPTWSGSRLEREILDGGFVGVKVYLSHSASYLPEAELRIYDYLPRHQLEVLDDHGWIVMLHIPRHGRLQDPVNLHQMLEIEQAYPNLKIIIAHVGRAYCDHDVGEAFEVLKPATSLYWDFSANTNATVFRQLVDNVPRDHILFGSDLPITRMRMRRIQRDGRYVNLVPPGLYGDVSGDPNMAEVSPEEAGKLTLFMYEELLAFKQAATAAGLSRDELDGIFYRNAQRLLASVR